MLQNSFIRNIATMLSSVVTPQRTRPMPSQVFIVSGQVMTSQRLFLLRQSVNAVSQLWVNKANAYIASLCLDFDFSPRDLSNYLSSIMVDLGFTAQEQQMLCNWIRGYETGIRTYINMNKY